MQQGLCHADQARLSCSLHVSLHHVGASPCPEMVRRRDALRLSTQMERSGGPLGWTAQVDLSGRPLR